MTAQKAYFIDGYHGGVYGHYPKGYTRFIVDQLKENPFWKINLEIEPETWDTVLVREPESLKELQQLFSDQSMSGRIEYVNPAYGQSYMYNISGESIIRHLDYGMKKLRQYFPGAIFSTYSSEEPCFTSALPQILTSFGFKYASLKNPNTCWGGYTRAYGGELVNWVGPDGTKIITVPRYATEGLLKNSTWQTEAWTNDPAYIKKAIAYGIRNPVAMTLQDAGWRNGPWIGNGNKGYQPTEYKTWRGYIENASIKSPALDWHFTQEDVLVSLVWGSQVLQKIAQEVRTAENKIIMAEKMSALAKVYQSTPWPAKALDEAWRTLMLSQHHDCWIVPYNGHTGNTWADKVAAWTNNTNRISDSVSMHAFGEVGSEGRSVRVFNITGILRKEWVRMPVPASMKASDITLLDQKNKEVISQVGADGVSIYFQAVVPALGYNTYHIAYKKPSFDKGTLGTIDADGNVVLENDLYKLVLDKAKGGAIKSLVAKTLGNKELVDRKNRHYFNELRGNFYNDGGFHATSEHPVEITITENGPAMVKAEIKGSILSHPYIQTITLRQGDRKIDCYLKVDWQGNVGIGSDYKQHGGLDPKDYTKPFYDDSQKLLALFPVAFTSQKIYKDAPFDVTESKLANTFFTRWDSIRNNIMLSWVDIYDDKNHVGLALLSDHTTTYAHGKDISLGLNVQYSGAGLWGRNHTLTGPTEIRYALVPHTGRWDQGKIATEALTWNEPLLAYISKESMVSEKSLIDVSGTGLQVTTIMPEGNDLLIRLFNAEGSNRSNVIVIGGQASAAELVELNGSSRQKLNMQKNKNVTSLTLAMHRFGLRTIRLVNFRAE